MSWRDGATRKRRLRLSYPSLLVARRRAASELDEVPSDAVANATRLNRSTLVLTVTKR